MANQNVAGTVRDVLNRCMPVAKYVRLGDLLDHLVTNVNALQVSHLALTAKMDLDAGITDTNYASLTNPVKAASAGTGAITAITVLEDR